MSDSIRLDRVHIRPASAGRFPRVPDGVYEVALGSGAKYTIVVSRSVEPGCLWIALEGVGCAPFTRTPQPDYVQAALGVDLRVAKGLTDFVACQLDDHTHTPVGFYWPGLCELRN